jgi:oxygen-independent coproporphyrinogen-3 oxidase
MNYGMSLASINNSLHFESLPPLSLYIHIPWCVRKCPYCDFNSHAVGTNAHNSDQQIPEADYIECLIADLEADLALTQDRKLQSIFFGGGTPSLFSGKGIASILDQVQQRIPFSENIEITLEANPGTVEQEKFHDFYQAGINRLSIGIQSFNDQHLKQLGRIHSASEAIKAVSAARAAGFTNFNLDLMHGLPEQTPEQALADLQQAIDLQPTHLSWYQLTLETNTEFYNNPPQLPAEDTLADIQLVGEKLLSQYKFQQYEVSAYSLPNKRSQHNLNYWQFGDYLGIGAGAHGKITLLEQQKIIRNRKTRLPRDYMNRDKPFSPGNKTVPADELAFEFMMNSLRLNDGFEKNLFHQRSGQSIKNAQNTINDLIAKQLLEEDSSHIKTTELGRRYLNSVIEAFLQA